MLIPYSSRRKPTEVAIVNIHEFFKKHKEIFEFNLALKEDIKKVNTSHRHWNYSEFQYITDYTNVLNNQIPYVPTIYVIQGIPFVTEELLKFYVLFVTNRKYMYFNMHSNSLLYAEKLPEFMTQVDIFPCLDDILNKKYYINTEYNDIRFYEYLQNFPLLVISLPETEPYSFSHYPEAAQRFQNINSRFRGII